MPVTMLARQAISGGDPHGRDGGRLIRHSNSDSHRAQQSIRGRGIYLSFIIGR
jgi:hypothetical protein